MTTSKGTIQGYNDVVAVDKKHQIIIDAQAFGKGQEHHTLTPVLTSIKNRFANIGISKDIYKEGVIVTASAGFANDDNYQYMRDEQIDAYIPDNQFRSRDKNFAGQKEKHGKRGQENVKGIKSIIPSTEFHFDKKYKRCICPQGNEMWLKNEITEDNGKHRLFF